MPPEQVLYKELSYESFLEYAFLRWVLGPAVHREIKSRVVPQQKVLVDARTYRIDYALNGEILRVAVELDGFEFHGNRHAFTYDRLRQNDLHADGWTVLRFSYDSIRLDTGRCVSQLRAVLALDPLLEGFLITNPLVEKPDMDPNPLFGFSLPPRAFDAMTHSSAHSYFDTVRDKLNLKTLRDCQKQALAALGNYYHSGGTNACCVMSVGAGKTALGVCTSLAFTKLRAMVITPGSVIRGTFDKAFDHQAVGNALYGLPNGPLIPGCKPPNVMTLDRENAPIRSVTREDLLKADVIVTNFHSLGTGSDEDDLLAKLHTEDIDLIVVDEAHIAASDLISVHFNTSTPHAPC